MRQLSSCEICHTPTKIPPQKCDERRTPHATCLAKRSTEMSFGIADSPQTTHRVENVTCDKKPDKVENFAEKSPKSHETLSSYLAARTVVSIAAISAKTDRKINVVKVLPERSKMSLVPVSEAAVDHERVGVREGGRSGVTTLQISKPISQWTTRNCQGT